MKKLALFWSSDSIFYETGISNEPVLKPISVADVSKINDKYHTDISHVL